LARVVDAYNTPDSLIKAGMQFEETVESGNTFPDFTPE
jgi:hypothetical protein